MRSTIMLRSPWRFPAAAAAVVTAAIHVVEFPSTWQENPLVGAGFLALATLCATGAAVLMDRDTPLAWLALATVCAAADAAYVYSRAIGLPGMADDAGNWTEPAGVSAMAAQTLVVMAAAAAAVTGRATAATTRLDPPAAQRS